MERLFYIVLVWVSYVRRKAIEVRSLMIGCKTAAKTSQKGLKLLMITMISLSVDLRVMSGEYRCVISVG